MDIARAVVFIFVFIIINIPIFTQLYNIFLKRFNNLQIVVISVLYWASAIFTENLIPFIVVVILVFNYHLKTEENNSLRNNNVWKFEWKYVFGISIFTLIFMVVLTLINSVYILILNYFLKYDIKPQSIVTDFYNSGSYVKVVYFLLIVIFAPFVEEYVFRYYLYDKIFLSYMPAAYAATLSAAIFTIAHYNAGGVPSFFGLALFCNYIYEKKGYFAAVAAHLIFNLSTIVLLLFIEI
ncbi:MAG: CPBP family intramembrane metalloprotease [Clostridiales bacterium]|nr:CPBP family intramembrane metalloprotease [Clostridiales bacterium]